jgi:hypothetical protein
MISEPILDQAALYSLLEDPSKLVADKSETSVFIR